MGKAVRIKTTVLGMGNLLMKDDGVGVHVVNALQEAPSSEDIELEVIDGATSPEIALLLDEVDKLVVIDAAWGGGAPGTIYRFRPEDITPDDGILRSVHQVSLVENLKLMRHLGKGPEDVVIIGVEPEEVDCGLELSPEIQKLMPKIIEVVLEEIGLAHISKPEKGE